MAYVPDPTDVTQPIESVLASTAAAEFRALKQYIQSLVLGTGQLAAFRNVLRNGDADLNQRVAGIVSANAYYCDAWRYYTVGTNRCNASRNAVTHAQVFPQTHRISVINSGAPAAGDMNFIQTIVEGFDSARFLYGFPSARVGTLSFWVYSDYAGQYSMFLQNSALNRSIVLPFNVLLPGVWEKKTLQVPGDTAGAWLADTGVGIRASFAPAIGTTFLTPNPGVWQAGDFRGLTGQQQFCTNPNGANIYFAELQFEQSSFATPFEYLSKADKLARALRYCHKTYAQATAPGTATQIGRYFGGSGVGGSLVYSYSFPAVMRAAPTVTVWDYNGVVNNAITFTGGGVTTSRGISAVTSTDRCYELQIITTDIAASGHLLADADY